MYSQRRVSEFSSKSYNRNLDALGTFLVDTQIPVPKIAVHTAANSVKQTTGKEKPEFLALGFNRLIDLIEEPRYDFLIKL